MTRPNWSIVRYTQRHRPAAFIGLIGLAAIADGVAAWPGGVGQQRREPHHPPVDSDTVDLDAALGE
jgi:hypothetical protein